MTIPAACRSSLNTILLLYHGWSFYLGTASHGNVARYWPTFCHWKLLQWRRAQTHGFYTNTCTVLAAIGALRRRFWFRLSHLDMEAVGLPVEVEDSWRFIIHVFFTVVGSNGFQATVQAAEAGASTCAGLPVRMALPCPVCRSFSWLYHSGDGMRALYLLSQTVQSGGYFPCTVRPWAGLTCHTRRDLVCFVFRAKLPHI